MQSASGAGLILEGRGVVCQVGHLDWAPKGRGGLATTGEREMWGAEKQTRGGGQGEGGGCGGVGVEAVPLNGETSKQQRHARLTCFSASQSNSCCQLRCQGLYSHFWSQGWASLVSWAEASRGLGLRGGSYF